MCGWNKKRLGRKRNGHYGRDETEMEDDMKATVTSGINDLLGILCDPFVGNCS